MEMKEILNDALLYPFYNIKSLVIYIILGIILGIAVAGTVAAIAAGVAVNNIFAVVGSGILGFIVAIFIGFIINGYELDIIKYGIERSDRAPEIDVIRQFINGVKYFVVVIVYMIIPIIVSSILAIFFQHWLIVVITVILAIIFAFALMMAECRLAKTEDLFYALSIREAIGDISKVGFINILLLLIVLVVISLVLSLIIGVITQWNSIIGGILMGILSVYITFFASRSIGLLYSKI